MKISQRAFDLIVREEVSSEAYYTRHYERPEWPGASSGITIGIGYDLGYATPQKIRSDFAALVDGDTLLAMIHCSGITGTAAQQLLPEVRGSISIPWSAAIAVFSTRDVPQWTAAVINACPGALALTPTCLGVIVSIAYNRGVGGFLGTTDRFTEMRAIRADIAARNLNDIPDRIRSMERLWPNLKGLRDRREHEADLFASGINTIDIVADVPDAPGVPSIPLDNRPARTKPPKTSKTQNGTAGAIVVAGGTAAGAAHAHGLVSTNIAIFVAFLAVLAAITIWVTVFQHRNPPPIPLPPDPPLPPGFPRHF